PRRQGGVGITAGIGGEELREASLQKESFPDGHFGRVGVLAGRFVLSGRDQRFPPSRQARTFARGAHSQEHEALRQGRLTATAKVADERHDLPPTTRVGTTKSSR